MWSSTRRVTFGIDCVLQRTFHQPGGNLRGMAISSKARKRRSVYKKALADPNTHPGTLKKLREGAAIADHDLLRYLAENKVGKAVTTADRRNLWFTLTFKRYAPIFLGQMKPRMQFWTAALDQSQMPLPQLPEVAIAGRSNSGKSTLVNYLCGRHSAKVKREPGSTTELVFWRIGRPAQLCLVDLPGYGFAYAPEERRLQWTEFALWYLRSRRNLSRVLLLIDARQSLKPADKEMIAYLERHAVKWQIIVSKCDCVKSKDLARKLTVLQEDLAGYARMAGPPIPISALKRMGMEKLRDVLDKMKVQKEVVKDGIKRRVYDLLEQKRIQRAERARLRRERRNQEMEQKRAMEQHTDVESQGQQNTDIEQKSDSPQMPSLHDILGGSLRAHSLDSSANAVGAETHEVPTAPRLPQVAEARYALDDRDSLRVAGLASTLFPALPDVPSVTDGGNAPTQYPMLFEDAFPEAAPSNTKLSSVIAERQFQNITYEPTAFGAEDTESESDSDDTLHVNPSVLRFDPMPAHARDAEAGTVGSDGLDGFNFGDPLRESSRREQVVLRPGWARPHANQDRIYDSDDFASPADIASGFRRNAGPAPTAETAGQLMTEARLRYEREWATELESIDGVRTHLKDSEGPGSQRPIPAKAATKISVAAKVQRKPVAESRPSYITKGGRKTLTKGRASWRLIGRPPATILKKLRVKDVAKVFNVRDRRGRKRNMGDGLDWNEAKSHWIKWFQRNKTRRHRVLEADSPKKVDVEADFERRREFLLRRRRRNDGDANNPKVRTGPGGAAMSLKDE